MPLSSDDFLPSDYPSDFSRDARNAVEVEGLRAEKDLESFRSGEFYSSRFDEAALMEVLCRRVVAFGRQGLLLVNAGTWTLERNEREVWEFCRRKAIEMNDRLPRRNLPRGWIDSWGQLRPELIQGIKKFQQWKQYEQEVLAFAERLCSPSSALPRRAAGPPAEPESVAVLAVGAADSKLPGNIKRLRKKTGLTQDEFAAKLGISLTQVKAHETGRATPQDRNLLLYAQLATKTYGREITMGDFLTTEI